MRKKIKVVVTHPLIAGSATIFLGSIGANILNFLFNFFMVRNLPPADYGELTSLVSLVALSTMPAASLMPMLVNFAAKFYAKNEMSQIRGLFFRVTKVSSTVGVILFIFFVVFSPWIGSFLQIKNTSLIIITGFIALFGYIGVTNSAILQAKLAFTFISISNLISAMTKLFFGLVFIMVGFGAVGAISAFALSYVAAYLFSFLQLGFIFDKKIKNTHLSIVELFSYGAPAAVSLLALTSFITIDLLLVKHFFSPEEAGVYAAISLIGRIIFFISAPIGNVMFPLVVQRHAKKEKYKDIFILALLLVLIPSLILTLFYYLFPDFVIMIFNQGKSMALVKPYLVPFGIFITFYSLLSVITNLLLSLGKTKIFVPLIIGALLQAGLIWIYHETFLEIIAISTIVVSLLLLVLLFYYWKIHGKRK